jgi:hypothetical protein
MFWAALVAKHQARAFSGAAQRTTRILSSSSSSASSFPSSRTMMVTNNRQREMRFRLMSTAVDLDDLNKKIQGKGEEIRQLKADGIDKAALAPHIQELLALKAQLPADESSSSTAPPPKQEKKKQKQPQKEKKTPQPKKVEETMSESELRLSRLSKVESMREAGVEPFEYSFDPTRSAAQLISEYDGRLEGGEEDEESDVSVAGRIMTRRVFGKLAFFTLQDETGTIQLQFDKLRLGEAFQVRACVDRLCSYCSW